MTHLDPNQVKLIGQGHSSKLKFGEVKYSIVGKKNLKNTLEKSVPFRQVTSTS